MHHHAAPNLTSETSLQFKLQVPSLSAIPRRFQVHQVVDGAIVFRWVKLLDNLSSFDWGALGNQLGALSQLRSMHLAFKTQRQDDRSFIHGSDDRRSISNLLFKITEAMPDLIARSMVSLSADWNDRELSIGQGEQSALILQWRNISL